MQQGDIVVLREGTAKIISIGLVASGSPGCRMLTKSENLIIITLVRCVSLLFCLRSPL